MNEKTTAEFEIKVSGGRIIGENLPLKNGRYKVVVVQYDVFVKVEASKLSLNDVFMQYQPRTWQEQEFKELVETVIKNGLKDFWRPVCDPSFDENGGICYEPGKIPAVGKSYNWWAKTAKEFKPECKSRLGTKTEYIAFLAVLIKKLVEGGWTVSDAWHAVCIDSRKLGNYNTSPNSPEKRENTGCREVCGFFDLANVYKIFAEDEYVGGFYIAGGAYFINGNGCPLAVWNYRDFKKDMKFNCGVGWLVLEHCLDC